MKTGDDECYHCGLPVGPESVQGDGKQFCCLACKTVYETIVAGGLGLYYQRRTALPNQPPTIGGYHPSVGFTPVRQASGEVEGDFIVKGIHCAACCWLVEEALGSCEGVHNVSLNYSNSRMFISWDPSLVTFEELSERIGRFGYSLVPYDPAKREKAELEQRRDFWLRLAVAGFGAGNAMLVAAALYAGYFQGQEEIYRIFFSQISFVLATPVVFFSARPFFKGAVRVSYYGCPRSLGRSSSVRI